MKFGPLAVAVGLILAVPGGPVSAADSSPIVVSSKIDTEGALLGNIVWVLLGDRGLPIENKISLGPTRIVRSAILANQIDLYPEYTGNGAFFFLKESDPEWRDPAKSFEKIRALDRDANGLSWIAPAPADNGWGIAIRKELAEGQNIRTLEDFARYINEGGRIKLAASIEFVDSPAALPAFEQTYGFHLSQHQLLALAGGDTAATIRASAEGTDGVNATMAYGTDGAIASLGLVLLKDTKHAQILYQPAVIVRTPVLEKHPEIAEILTPVFASLTIETLQQLNARIAVNGEDAGTVATAYLASRGFIRR